MAQLGITTMEVGMITVPGILMNPQIMKLWSPFTSLDLIGGIWNMITLLSAGMTGIMVKIKCT